MFLTSLKRGRGLASHAFRIAATNRLPDDIKSSSVKALVWYNEPQGLLFPIEIGPPR